MSYHQQDPQHFTNGSTPSDFAPKKKFPHKFAYIVAVLFSIGLGVAIGQDVEGGKASYAGSTSTARPTTTVTVTEKPLPQPTKEAEKPKSAEVTVTAGVYEVGTDIKPGTYKSTGNDALCYWARLKDTSGDMGTIIANDLGEGSKTVTIKKTDGAFKTSGCSVWVLQQ